ncbi:UNVERIFIED_ORG: 7-keto-8-aminopelargonate synthetase-like enzyme [Methylobacterium sp. SuP10 SLI 274]|uniref:aminotransferase class I/II-fold pyridoxal phosphate-dependent enzyme n=1 Tax=Methylorubrum extorquens TaxID=408 RepID=UPI0020A18EB5|nr:aminotransferase class I/II-fold pyridoxal phosphate-dependent enzyme [Methylorubrum extorquens]MDF9866441.1 7-keto-8-aminopelargonate synthetase-like enzyme [Methylorubrum pseudosasae]MDH6639950.1 7-keto-8-aminopelargonate synthetase-like enzyme [Methylobacterium sp. SuP10 SLI 274]MDH6669318.1 7-keto-8-aminopelargonate synthetase-like enzyme [Methylorubrum zatmanii]MCP1561917.1 7-keto-8-aminopelargonate synthetase-like enzyme [Methylorubrum extorquens]MDF9794711.1 7-keto-8-aminopelargonate
MTGSQNKIQRNLFRNTAKMVRLSEGNWGAAESAGLVNFYVNHNKDGTLAVNDKTQSVLNMSSYSYLGLNRHPKVINGAIEALQNQGVTGLGITPTRIQPNLYNEVQEGLSDIFRSECLLALSCSTASAGLLPLVSSGHLIDGKPRVTVFDKKSHYCMDVMKPVCADEAPVITCPHNDMSYLEDLCKKYDRVAYIADGAYSMGGTTDLSALLYLQDRYGLFCWLDDSHAISVLGDKGEGYVRSNIDEMNALTIITGSLEKGFGCSGGVVMLNRGHNKRFINYFGGALCWSQSMSVANLGSIKACIGIHSSGELKTLQSRLRSNISIFDENVKTEQEGSLLPVRAIVIGDLKRAINISKQLFDKGYYTSPVYFPVAATGREGLRVMVRADVSESTYREYVGALSSLI